MTNTTTKFVHTLDGEPCDGPEYPDDALCQAHGRLWRAVATTATPTFAALTESADQ